MNNLNLDFSEHEPYIKERRDFILERCAKPNWAGEGEKIILSETFDGAIIVMKAFMNFVWKNYAIKIACATIMPNGHGSIGLEFDNYEENFTLFHTYNDDENHSGYGDNVKRQWREEGMPLSYHKDEKTLTVLRAYKEWGKDYVRVEVRAQGGH